MTSILDRIKACKLEEVAARNTARPVNAPVNARKRGQEAG
jgi:hypothetical protein